MRLRKAALGLVFGNREMNRKIEDRTRRLENVEYERARLDRLQKMIDVKGTKR